MAVRVALRPLFAASPRAIAPPSAATAFPAVARLAQTAMPARSFTQTRGLGLKESSSKDPNPEETHKHVLDSLSKQKRGEGHWKQELASDSEEHLRADREARLEQQTTSTTSRTTGSGAASEVHIKELQERTKLHAEEKSKAGTSVREG